MVFNLNFGKQTLTCFTSGGCSQSRIIQRSEGQTTGVVKLQGRYIGSAPSGLQSKIVNIKTGAITSDWTNMTSYVASGGGWTATGQSVAQTPDIDYTAYIRSADDHSIIAQSPPFGVGINYLMTGQSNEGTFGASGSSTLPTTGVYHINRDNNEITDYTLCTFVGGNDTNGSGDGHLTLSYAIAQALGVCVCGLSMSYNATSVDGVCGGDWDNLTAPAITKFFDNDFEFIHWNQGENEYLYSFGWPYRIYFDYVDSMHTKALALTGRTSMPIYMSSLGWSQNWPGNTVDDANYIVPTNKAYQQQVYLDAHKVLPYIQYINSNIPSHTATHDQHKDALGSLWDGQRGAPSVLYYQYGIGSGPSPWYVTGVSPTDATHTRLTLTHSRGTDFTPSSGGTGFLISGNDGATWEIPSSVDKVDSTHIDLTHSSMSTAIRALRYQFDGDCDLTNPIFDNSTPVAFPLNYIINPLRNNASVPIPVRQESHGNIQLWDQPNLTVHQTRQTIVANTGDLIILGYISGQSPTPNTVTITLPDSSTISFTKVVGNDSSIWHAVATKDIGYADVCQITWTYPSNPSTNPDAMTVWVVDHTKLSSPSTPLTTLTGSASANAVYPSIPAPTLNTTSGGFIIAVSNAPTTTGRDDIIKAPRCVQMNGSTEAFCDDSSWVRESFPSQKAFHASNVGTHASSVVTISYSVGSEPLNGNSTYITAAAWR